MRAPTLLLFAAACSAESPDALSFDVSSDVYTLGWTESVGVGQAPPPAAGVLVQAHAAMVGAPLRVGVGGIPAGATVLLVASLQGTGVGPCHPSGVCVDVLAPRLLGSTIAPASGRASFRVMPPRPGLVAFQAVVY